MPIFKIFLIFYKYNQVENQDEGLYKNEIFNFSTRVLWNDFWLWKI